MVSASLVGPVNSNACGPVRSKVPDGINVIAYNQLAARQLIDIILGAVNSPSCWPVIQDHNGRVYNGLRGQLTRVQISSLIQLAVTDLF